MVEDDGGRHPQARRGLKAVAEFDGGQGVEPQLLEGAFCLDGVGRRVAEDGRHMGADQVENGPLPVGVGQPGQLGGQGRGVGRRPFAASRSPEWRADQAPQDVRDAVGAGPDRRGVEVDRHRHGHGRCDGRVEQPEAFGDGEFEHAPAVDARHVGRAELPPHALALSPQAPGHGPGGQALGTTEFGEGVEEEVGRRVVALSGAVHQAGRRREQYERGQGHVAGQLVQVPGAVHLGPQHVVQLLRGQGVDDAVVGDTGRVHDACQGVFGVDGGEEPGQRVTIGHIARLDAHRGARSRCGQFRYEVGGAVGSQARAADQQQVAYAVLGHEVSGHDAAQAAGAARDQHGSGGGP
ncbi:hypothetical protein GCM10018775_30850 [Streptomyces umbrinus]|nr:hypothetical protein GCM10018775_30850 [Streptomyces umbrinus]